MISGDDIRAKIRDVYPDAIVQLEDLTGGQDHWSAVVVTSAFEGKNRVERHRMVHAPLRDDLVERLHALTMKTYTPAQARELGLLED